ncbi:MAG: hypothetical protein ABR587_15760 [Candidatus Binatia bacterium]
MSLWLAAPASAQTSIQPIAQQYSAEPHILSTPKLLYDSAMPRIYGVSQPLAPRWKATYGLGLAAETSISSAFLRLDELIDSGQLDARAARENWRHFLGLEFSPMEGTAIMGGIAKAGGINGNKGAGLAPTGYERLRLNTGARWRGRSWGLDGSFSFIPNGATRFPGDASFFPGMGGSGSTWLLSLTVSRRF